MQNAIDKVSGLITRYDMVVGALGVVRIGSVVSLLERWFGLARLRSGKLVG